MATESAAFPVANESSLQAIEIAINRDADFQAASNGAAEVCFGLGSRGSEQGIIISIEHGSAKVHLQPNHQVVAQFVLLAQPIHWKQFFAKVPPRPFQSYWGMLRLLGRDSGVEVTGDVAAFISHARLWRVVLDRIREGLNCVPTTQGSLDYIEDDERDDDSIIGHYTWLTLSPLGRCKIFYETSGQGSQQVLFLHTAGADSRQYHSLMLNPGLQQKCTMYAFDLPGHGRSFPGTHQHPLSYANSEEFYVSAIASVISKLKLKRVVVSGASMGGQVCLAVALRARELDVKGVVPCEACDYLPSAQAQTIYSLAGDESILNAERVCGMMSPTSPALYKRLNWWIYSSQASKIFPGDLKFYFDGWDGRDRVAAIDTALCPVYMLTGQYDYSCTPDASRATAAKIRGAVMEEMEGLGHFPFSEDPERFMPYFNRALEHISEHGHD